MKLCFSTLGCPEWGFGDVLATAYDLGYDGIEIRGMQKELYAPRIPVFQPDKIEQTKAQLEKLKLCIPCLTSDNVLHKAPEVAVQHLTEYIALAKALGTPYIRVMADDPVPHPREAVDEETVLAAARSLAPIAEEKGVMLLIETNGWYSHSGRLKALLQRINSPAFGALWDVHHPYRFYGESPQQTAEILGDSIKHVHIKDSRLENGKPKYALLGYGDLPISEFIHTLRGQGYMGYYSLEWVKRWNLSLEEPGIAFAQYSSYMRAM